MKIYLLNNSENDDNLYNNLKRIYNIKSYKINSIEEANKIFIENREWIITSKYCEISNVIANQSSSIIYLYKKEDNINDFIKKYSSKIIIIKTKKEIKKLYNAIFKGIEL